jgi:hypothetical protein
MKCKSLIPAFVLLGIAVMLAGGACTKAKPKDAGAGDFVEVRMRISRTPDDSNTCDFEEVFRIAFPETARRYEPRTLPEGRGSVETFGIGCQVVSLSSRSLSENQEKVLKRLTGPTTFPYGITRSGKDPSQYYITFVGNAVGQFRAADETAVFQQAGAWLRANFAARISELLHDISADEVKLAATLNRPSVDDQASILRREILGDRAITSGDFVTMRMRIYRIAGYRRSRVFDKAIRLSLSEKPPLDVPVGKVESPASYEAFSVGCQVESYSIQSLKDNQKRYLKWLTAGVTQKFGISRSANDPLQYYFTNGNFAMGQLRTADEAELFRAAESCLGALFGQHFRMTVGGIPADEAECAATLRRIHYPDEPKEPTTDHDPGKK